MLNDVGEDVSTLTESELLKGIYFNTEMILKDVRAPIIEKGKPAQISENCEKLIEYIQPFINVLQDENLSIENRKRI